MLNLNTGPGDMVKFMITLILFPLVMAGQTTGDVGLTTGRAMYITGEQIEFSAVVNDESTVLYAEILTPKGNSIARGKFMVTDKRSSGCVTIPADVITGVYFLRAYIRVMRNDGPETYAYLAIRIINPLVDQVLPGNEQVRWEDYPDQRLVPTVKALGSDNTEYCREQGGVAISGLVKSTSTGRPLIGEMVNLSILGGENELMSVRTDQNGRFNFVMPELYGWREIYLGASGLPSDKASGSKGLGEVSVLADNDFCTLPLQLPSYIFTLSTEERSVAYNLAVNARKVPALTDSISPDNKRSFYGTPHQLLSLAEYVQLPTLEEYLNELPGIVKVRRVNGKKQFRVMGSQVEMTEIPPLVLIDYVPVDDVDKILAVPPIAIDRIEMINEPYLKGGTLYGGIISIYSKKGDFAGVELPASGIFIKYRFLEESKVK